MYGRLSDYLSLTDGSLKLFLQIEERVKMTQRIIKNSSVPSPEELAKYWTCIIINNEAKIKKNFFQNTSKTGVGEAENVVCLNDIKTCPALIFNPDEGGRRNAISERNDMDKRILKTMIMEYKRLGAVKCDVCVECSHRVVQCGEDENDGNQTKKTSATASKKVFKEKVLCHIQRKFHRM